MGGVNIWLEEATKNEVLLKIVLITLATILSVKIIDLLFKIFMKSAQPLHIAFFRKILKVIIGTYGVIAIFSIIPGIKESITTLLTSGGLILVVLGFTAQEALSNVLNGMMISIFRPFKIGDRIKILNSNITGVVEDISLRHTIITNFNNSRIIIPNSLMNKAEIENSHFRDERTGSFIDIPIDYKSNLNLAMDIVAKAVCEHPLYIDIRTEEEIEKGSPMVSVAVREITTSGIWLRATVWTDEINSGFQACSDIRVKILEDFKKNKIKIYDQRVVLTNVGGLL